MRQLPFENYLNDLKQGFTGWDFGYLTKTSRMQEFPLPWNYYNTVLPYVREADSLLDMGTGGGEFLTNLVPFPKFAFATEAYEPNVQVAKQRLEPYGVEVVRIGMDDLLPFEADSFQLIINRHESYLPSELQRILKARGRFITQQVGGWNDQEFNDILGAPPSEYFDWNLARAISELSGAGLQVDYSDELITATRFYDMGAVLYYLKIIEWQIKDFSVERYRDGLEEIYRRIEANGYLDVTCHRFILAASK